MYVFPELSATVTVPLFTAEKSITINLVLAVNNPVTVALVPPLIAHATVVLPVRVKVAPDEIVTLPDVAVVGTLLVTVNVPAQAPDGVLAVKLPVPPDAVKLVMVEDPVQVEFHAPVALAGAVPV